MRIDVARSTSQALHDQARVVRQPPVMEERALGKPGRARGVLNLGAVVRGHRREVCVRRTGKEFVPGLHGDDGAERRQMRPDLRHRFRHRVAAEARYVEEPDRTRLAQHVLQLPAAIGGVHRHHDDARQSRTELEQQPFGKVGRPDRDVRAGREAGEQGHCRALRIAQQPGERPCPPYAALEPPANDRRLVRSGGSRGAQDGPDRRFPDWLGGVSRPMRFLESHHRPRFRLRSPSRRAAPGGQPPPD